MKVFSGGVAGIETLMESSSSTTFRFKGGGIYLHGVGWGLLNTQQRKAVFHANCGSPFMVELGFGQGELHDEAWAKRFMDRYISIGITPDFCTSNCFGKGSVPTVERWKSFIQDFRNMDYKNPIYPIFEYANHPNHRNELSQNFVSTRLDFQKIIAYSGGIAIDTAGLYFFNQPNDYKSWIIDALRWTKSIGCKAITYASPHLAQAQYKYYTLKYIDYLIDKGVKPDIVVIGNYRANEPENYITVVGREWIENTCLEVALHALENYN